MFNLLLFEEVIMCDATSVLVLMTHPTIVVQYHACDLLQTQLGGTYREKSKSGRVENCRFPDLHSLKKRKLRSML